MNTSLKTTCTRYKLIKKNDIYVEFGKIVRTVLHLFVTLGILDMGVLHLFVTDFGRVMSCKNVTKRRNL